MGRAGRQLSVDGQVVGEECWVLRTRRSVSPRHRAPTRPVAHQRILTPFCSCYHRAARPCGILEVLAGGEESSASFLPKSLSFLPLLPTVPTMSAPLVVSPATPSDLVRIAQIQRLSFGPTPIFQSMFGAVAPSSIDAFNVVRLTGWLKDSTAAVVKVSRGDEILGYSYWDLPSAVQETAAVVSPPREWAEGTNVAIAVDFFKRLDEHGSHIQGRHYRASHPA